MQLVYEPNQKPSVNKFMLKRFENKVRKDRTYEIKCKIIDALVENWDCNLKSR